MLLVTVELCPGGDKDRKQEVATIQISNVSNLAEVSDYIVDAWFESPLPRRFVATNVRAHERAKGWLPLVMRALRSLKDAAP